MPPLSPPPPLHSTVLLALFECVVVGFFGRTKEIPIHNRVRVCNYASRCIIVCHILLDFFFAFLFRLGSLPCSPVNDLMRLIENDFERHFICHFRFQFHLQWIIIGYSSARILWFHLWFRFTFFSLYTQICRWFL